MRVRPWLRSHALVSSLTLAAIAALALVPASAKADARGVGLGVAAGLDYSKYQDSIAADDEFHPSFSWGFFVDIPLLETFYVSPATTLYTLDLGGGRASVTDIDMNFKFIVPLGDLRLGAGLTAGLTTGLGDYRGHWGGLGYASLALVPNLEGFVLAQYKTINFGANDIEKVHVYGGGMFRF